MLLPTFDIGKKNGKLSNEKYLPTYNMTTEPGA
jgi:hypothetical protein